jgi:hypothetical protein
MYDTRDTASIKGFVCYHVGVIFSSHKTDVQ